MAKTVNIGHNDEFFTGEDKTVRFTVAQADDVTPQDITGWTLSWMVKRKPTDVDASAVITKTTASGIQLTTPEQGICTVSVTDDDTTTLKAGLYYHELKRTNPGVETVLSQGTVTLRQSFHKGA